MHGQCSTEVQTKMPDPLSFPIDAGHYAIQLDLDDHRPELAALGRRCADYIQLAVQRPVPDSELPGALLGLLRPRRVPQERSYVFGIRRREPQRLAGVLYILHPPQTDTWFIALLLIEPVARGKGLGAAVHEQFQKWAAARGARHLRVAVAERNPRAWHFWRDRLAYQPIETLAWKHFGAGLKHRELEHSLPAPAVPAPWLDTSLDGDLAK
jgi:GNAT superfamily N-acetyltransferase